MWHVPDWVLPDGVRAVYTDRIGGDSLPPFDGFNLGAHVGDAVAAVDANRHRLVRGLGLQQPVQWLEQVHGTDVVTLPATAALPVADAAFSCQNGIACAVMTADCLPVLLCNEAGTQVAAAHAGWRGLCDGVLESVLSEFECPGAAIRAWIGPAIGPQAFEVGSDVRQQFMAVDAEAATAFKVHGDRYLADLPRLAQQRLNRLGVNRVTLSGLCTYQHPERFFSYRRDGRCGRQASLIWLD
ncbi:peptidoglycan editing factor PgeF [Ferrimonas sp. SCSIO 43195]|uniref:peptidoglycan editing factor PgeF n=1 Tax=Ferrimonas sp. SCSIO 43195 TaxID=2822844 RepID=UPI0020758DDD|nr:peptidoglycan editing factor PgeF [Ferrimonas sp. SCSIO 43195]USD38224.1 peptidoglycan editing factor PgeF [Ferrimonas sp. SCSIO 43195]